MKISILATLFSILLLPASAVKKYVKPTGFGSGTSWANASGDLRTILSSAAANDTICVAAGTYKPTTGTDRALSFVIPS